MYLAQWFKIQHAIPGNKGTHSVDLMWWILAWGSLVHAPSPMNTDVRSCLVSTYRFWRDWKERTGCWWKGCDQRGISGWMICTSLWVHYCSTYGHRLMPSVPTQHFPTETWSAQPANEDWTVAPTAQTTKWVRVTTELNCFFHKLLNRMEINLMKNKQFLFYKKVLNNLLSIHHSNIP